MIGLVDLGNFGDQVFKHLALGIDMVAIDVSIELLQQLDDVTVKISL